MEVEFPGHIYKLEVRRSPNELYVQVPAKVTFMRFEGYDKQQWSGVTTQEILRCLIDRTWYCDTCLPSHLNDYIVHHLRMALVLHEARALLRKVEKGELKPELVTLGEDGHFYLRMESKVSSYAHEPRNRETDTGGPNPGVCTYPQGE